MKRLTLASNETKIRGKSCFLNTNNFEFYINPTIWKIRKIEMMKKRKLNKQRDLKNWKSFFSFRLSFITHNKTLNYKNFSTICLFKNNTWINRQQLLIQNPPFFNFQLNHFFSKKSCLTRNFISVALYWMMRTTKW